MVRKQVAFEDVRAGLLFVLTFAVQNISAETRRIRIIPPRTPVFSLNYEPVAGLAPGLDVRAEVEFQLPAEDETEDLSSPFDPGEVRAYTDIFLVISGKDVVSHTQDASPHGCLEQCYRNLDGKLVNGY